MVHPMLDSQRREQSLATLFRAWGLRRVMNLNDLTHERGTYLYLFRMPAIGITIGALGRIHLCAGLYGYVGSASGGTASLARRLARHRRKTKPRHWHIDYVTARPSVTPVSAFVSTGEALPEIALAHRCAEHFSVMAPFGNSDLRDKTPGHLFLLHEETRGIGCCSNS